MAAVEIVRTVAELRARVSRWRAAGETIGFAPTMGALHEGHISLLTLARSRCSKVVASIFVNPAQFGPHEDFAAYPRDEASDADSLAAAGCDLLYAPAAETIYPPGFDTRVTVGALGASMEGALRPGHFDGVATVVAKLLIQVAPDAATFGEKDYQQLAVIRRLTRDLDLPVEILAGQIARAPDGLALSSRNAYLTPRQRTAAPVLRRALAEAAARIGEGDRVETAEAEASAAILHGGFDGVDYVEARHPETLERLGPGPIAGAARLLAVARMGETRLLDNVAVG